MRRSSASGGHYADQALFGHGRTLRHLDNASAMSRPYRLTRRSMTTVTLRAVSPPSTGQRWRRARLVAVVLSLGACLEHSPTSPLDRRARPGGSSRDVVDLNIPVLLVAGDIASCTSANDEATAALLDTLSGIVTTTGDNIYNAATLDEFNSCYTPSWGRYISRTKPA